MRRYCLCLCLWFCALALTTATGAEDPFVGKKSGKIGPVKVLKTYDPAPETADIVYALDLGYSSDGSLVIQEGKTGRVHLWSASGKYINGCGGEGQGPGETEGLIRVELGKAAVYGYQFPGPLLVWPRLADGSLADNHASRKLPLECPFSQVFKVVTSPDGSERILLSGQHQNDKGLGPQEWSWLDPQTGKRQVIPALTVEPGKPIWDLFSADFSDPLRISAPRAWAAYDGPRLLVGFSENRIIYSLGLEGKTQKEFGLNLPQQLPDDDHIEQFYNTPIPIFLKTLKELNLSNLTIGRDIPMAYYSFFQPLPGGDLLLINTIFGGFNNVNYVSSGAIVRIYRASTGKVEARGTLTLPEDSTLYLHDDQVLLVRFDDAERLVIEKVALGWL